MKRIYHHYAKWEENTFGMWRIITADERDTFKLKAAELMKDTKSFEDAMRKASVEWKYSCEHNLTDTSINRLAWMGHAGCCIALGSPEDATRAGWWLLDEEQQRLANEAAERVIKEWELRQCQSENLAFQF